MENDRGSIIRMLIIIMIFSLVILLSPWLGVNQKCWCSEGGLGGNCPELYHYDNLEKVVLALFWLISAGMFLFAVIAIIVNIL